MDGLALLCNLHADGPLSLRRLRQSGIRTLAQVQRAPSASLAKILKATPAELGRFVKEAQLLRERMEAEPLEAELPPLDVEPDGPVAATEVSSAEPPQHQTLPEGRAPKSRAVSPSAAPVQGTVFRPGQLDGLDQKICE